MFLKIGGSSQVPTQTVMNEFRKRGIAVSLEQLQQMFPQGNGFLKNITNSVVEFDNNQPTVPGTFKKSQDDKAAVSDMALKAVRKRD